MLALLGEASRKLLETGQRLAFWPAESETPPCGKVDGADATEAALPAAATGAANLSAGRAGRFTACGIHMCQP